MVSDIDTALGIHGSCIQNPGTYGFLIFGSALVTDIIVRTASTGVTGVVLADPTAHTLLGFEDNQTSLEINVFTADSLAAAIRNQLPSGEVAVEETQVRITSGLEDFVLSSLFFDADATDAVQGSFGFEDTIESQPSYVELVDGDEVLVPGDVGVFIGSIVLAVEELTIVVDSEVRTINNQAITDIQDTRIFFDDVVLPRRNLELTIISPIVSAAQTLTINLLPYVGSFDKDVDVVQRILSPIVSKPTRAQIGDARRILGDVQTRLEALLDFLQAIAVRTDRSEFSSVATQVLSALEERGLDRAQELLSSGQFSVFFSLSSNNASKSNRLLTAMETVARQDLPVSTLEVDIDDDQTPRGTNPDSAVLEGSELDGSGTLVTDG